MITEMYCVRSPPCSFKCYSVEFSGVYSIYIVMCVWDMYKVIVYVFAGIASAFTLVRIFSEEVASTII